MTQGEADPAQHALEELDEVLDVEAAQVRSLASFQVGLAVAGPEQPHRLGSGATSTGQSLHLDTDESAGQDRRLGPVGEVLLAGQVRV